MRPLKKMFIAISLSLLSTMLAGKETSETQLLSIVVSYKYSTEKTEVFKEKKELYCHTEINPKFYISEKTKETDLKDAVEQVKSEAIKNSANANCSDLNPSFMLKYGKEVIKGCGDSPNAKKLIAKLAKICGRY